MSISILFSAQDSFVIRVRLCAQAVYGGYVVNASIIMIQKQKNLEDFRWNTLFKTTN